MPDQLCSLPTVVIRQSLNQTSAHVFRRRRIPSFELLHIRFERLGQLSYSSHIHDRPHSELSSTPVTYHPHFKRFSRRG